MFAPSRVPTECRGRRGSVAVEALFILPLLLLVVLGGVGIADLIIAEQIVDEASGRAARTAATGGSKERIRTTALAALGPERAKHAEVTVTVLGRQKKSDHDDEYDPAPGELLEIRVTVPARSATATRLAPLKSDAVLIGRSVIQHE